jgi:pyruvate/2-oxoglutarate dehydrogenase complex dihydrolipoamide dehydrogenase (E3) component/uncharacterized membrane protein YdjX (TVP38/TMEM64 family)
MEDAHRTGGKIRQLPGNSMKTNHKILLLISAGLLIALFYALGLQDYLDLGEFQARKDMLLDFRDQHPLYSSAVYFLGYILVTALSLPFAAVLTLIGAAVFGFWWSLLMVSFASTIGATLAFLLARTILRDWVRQKFADRLEAINSGMEKDGNLYLFTLRLIPVFPFFLVNMVIALTPISAFSFYWVSQLGMLFGTVLYVEVGSQLGLATSIPGIFSIGLIRAVVALSLFPWLARAFVRMLNRRRQMAGFTRPAAFDANVVVIGGGSAGLVTSLIASLAKAKVVLVEKGEMGGDCLNTGCVPSKTLLKSAAVAHQLARANEFGIESAGYRVDFAAVMQRVRSTITRIAPHDSVERYASLGVECIRGNATLLSPWTVQVGERVISGRSIVLATGARPRIPEIPGLADIAFHTSETIWQLQNLPETLLVLGGGPVGCELAQAFARLGSKVVLVNRAAALLPQEDPAVSMVLENALRSEGVCIRNKTSVARFQITDDRQVACLQAIGDDTQESLVFSALLVAVGRQPNTAGLGLEKLGMDMSAGSPAINDYLQTSFPHIYICGDLAGPWQFTHMAAFQAWYAAINSLFGQFWRFRVNYRVVPRVTFTDPEVARVGLNAREAETRGIPFELTRHDLQELDRALTDGDNRGFVEVLTVPGSDRILGASIVAAHAGELLNEFTQAMTHGLGLRKVLDTIHVYPTYSEANRYVAGKWRRDHAPTWLVPWLERWHRWRR